MIAVEELQGWVAAHIAKGGMVILTTHQEVELTRGALKQLNLDEAGSDV